MPKIWTYNFQGYLDLSGICKWQLIIYDIDELQHTKGNMNVSLFHNEGSNLR